MNQVTKNPFYSPSDYDSNCLDFQMSFLIRTAEDAQRIAACIYQHAEDNEILENLVSKLEPILVRWNDPDFSSHAPQAEEILERLDEMFTEAVDDYPFLESIRIPIYALQFAVHRRLASASVT